MIFDELSDTITIIQGDCLEILPTLFGYDTVITDPPFSDRTHKGHQWSVNLSDRTHKGPKKDKYARKKLQYDSWGEEEIKVISASLPDQGWCCFITDHTLVPLWEKYLIEAGRYVFAPLPLVVPGRTVRLSGDGPSNWTDWMVVSRTKNEIKWGTLPGYYQGSPHQIEYIGGKPTITMCAIVKDYSRKHNTVLDICMGAGTTGVACIRTGRKFIGIEKEPAAYQMAKKRLLIEIKKNRINLGII